MSESLTGEPAANTQPASNEPTGSEQQPTQAESPNQEAISREQSQEAVSQDNAPTQQTQTQQNGGSQNDDDGLAKFAKSQGFDPENLTDGERKALKIAHDNQKAYRNSNNEAKVTDVSKELNTPKADATEDEKFRSEFRQFKYEQQTNQFWSDATRDKALEPTMVNVLNEAKEKYGADYARTLSTDLETLYDLARLKSGAGSAPVDTDAIRREERESIRQQSNASAGQAHAVTQSQSGTKIDMDWVQNTYDTNNVEHRKLLDEAMARGDLY